MLKGDNITLIQAVGGIIWFTSQQQCEEKILWTWRMFHNEDLYNDLVDLDNDLVHHAEVY